MNRYSVHGIFSGACATSENGSLLRVNGYVCYNVLRLDTLDL